MSHVAALLLGALLGCIGAVLVALAGDPRQKRGTDTTSLLNQSERFDDIEWVGEWAPVITFSTRTSAFKES